MAFEIINGQPVKKQAALFKQRVAIVTSAGKGILQFVSATCMLRIQHAEKGAAPVYEAPTFSLWENIRGGYPERTAGLTFIGVLAAVTRGPFEGHIDWVQPIDGAMVMDVDARAKAAIEGHGEVLDPTGTELVRLPKTITEDHPFVLALMQDVEMQREIIGGKGGGDLLASVLRAAVRLAKEQPT